MDPAYPGLRRWLGCPGHTLSADSLLSQQPSEDLVPYDTDLYQRQTHEYYPYLSSDGESHSGEPRAPPAPTPSLAWAPAPPGSADTKRRHTPRASWEFCESDELVLREQEFTTPNSHTPILHLWSIFGVPKCGIHFFQIYLLVQSLWPLYKAGN